MMQLHKGTVFPLELVNSWCVLTRQTVTLVNSPINDEGHVAGLARTYTHLIIPEKDVVKDILLAIEYRVLSMKNLN